MTQGIVLVEHDQTIEAGAKRARLEVTIAAGYELAYEKTLFVAKGTVVPWKLVPAGFDFLDKWEAAAPLWRYGVLAEDVGGPAERERTQAVTKDLRVLLYAHELVFVRRCDPGERFLRVWQEEMAGGGEPRLAFLRALHLAKPMLCTLPASWLPQPVMTNNRQWLINTGQEKGKTRAERRSKALPDDFVVLEYQPGRFVRCRKGQEEFMRRRLAKLSGTREERQADG